MSSDGKHRITHNMSKTKIYRVYKAIYNRCNKLNTQFYDNYGGRGIKCEWDNFEEFYKDMGETYKEGLSIDRINNNGNYCKENCRWSTMKEQSKNRRSNLLIEYKGENKCLIDWCNIFNISYGTVYRRLKLGYDIEKSLFKPILNIRDSKGRFL